jgi:hypothetical protein
MEALSTGCERVDIVQLELSKSAIFDDGSHALLSLFEYSYKVI